MATAHAKNRPPSAAKRWLSCPFSASVTPMYPNDETDASLKGDLWHAGMEDLFSFGTLPLDCEPDMADALQDFYDYVMTLFKEYPGGKLYIEERIDIPETGEFGTVDILYVHPEIIVVADEKSGYVPVDVEYNDQELAYLLGAIARFGPRDKYRLIIHQPNFDHVDGTLRSWEPTHTDVELFRDRVLLSMERPGHIEAGPHCKASYCPHRGACEPFHEYVVNDLSLGWHPTELKGMDDATLAKALDAADQVNGYRQELRAEAMRRIMNMDRKIEGYKVVKGRRSRAVLDARKLVGAVASACGEEWARRLFPDLAWVQDLPFDREEVLKQLGTPKHIEDVLKQYARQNKLPKGGAKQLYDNVVGQYIRETASGLTLERAIDGRPAHKRGSEFGVLDPAKALNGTTVL